MVRDSLATALPYRRSRTYENENVSAVADLICGVPLSLLVQNGQNDPLYPPSLIPGEVNLVKNATVKVYPNVAHMPFFLAPDAFNQDLATWVLTKTTVPTP